MKKIKNKFQESFIIIISASLILVSLNVLGFYRSLIITYLAILVVPFLVIISIIILCLYLSEESKIKKTIKERYNSNRDLFPCPKCKALNKQGDKFCTKCGCEIDYDKIDHIQVLDSSKDTLNYADYVRGVFYSSLSSNIFLLILTVLVLPVLCITSYLDESIFSTVIFGILDLVCYFLFLFMYIFSYFIFKKQLSKFGVKQNIIIDQNKICIKTEVINKNGGFLKNASGEINYYYEDYFSAHESTTSFFFNYYDVNKKNKKSCLILSKEQLNDKAIDYLHTQVQIIRNR